MDEVYLLDSELNKKYIIDTYSSIIWTPRYNTLGDCELVISASWENIKKIKECKYMIRDDDEMACEIKKVELKTEVYVRRERFYGEVKRSFYIGEKKESDIKANYENGILTISFPKEEIPKKEIPNITIK